MAIDQLLKELDSWFNEPGIPANRAKLLSKLSTLELCGWIEERLDELAESSAKLCKLDADKSFLDVIGRTYGFDYEDNFRRLIVHLLGETGTVAAETAMETAHPGELQSIKSTLGSLRKVRGVLAHSPSVGAIKKQITIPAPSWVINQQRILSKQLTHLDAIICGVATKVYAAL